MTATRDLVTQAVRERIQGFYADGADVDIDVLDDPEPNTIRVKAMTAPFAPAPTFRITIEED